MRAKNLKSIIKVIVILFILEFPAYVYAQSSEIPLTTTSQEARSYFLEGRYKYENIQYANAAALFDEAILTDPGFAMAYLYRARCGGGFNIKQQYLQKAEELIDLISEGERHLILFQIALDEGDHVKQKKHILKLLDLFPADKRVHFNAGLYYDFIVDPPTALMHYLKAIQIDDKFAASYNKIGYDFIDLGFYQAAEEAFKKYINLIPNSPNPYDSYAELLMKMGHFDESINQYLTAYNHDKLFTQALAGVGHNYIFKSEFERAREYYYQQHESAVRMDEKLQALMWVVISYIHEDKINEAIKTLELRKTFAENENLIPNVIESYNAMGFILTETGSPETAKEFYDKAEEVISSSQLPQNIRDGYLVENHINHCYWLIMSGKLNEAEKEMSNCSNVVGRRDNMSEIKHMNLVKGIYTLKSGKPNAALDFFNQAATDNPYTWYYIAKAYQELGFEDAAESYFDRIKYWNQNSLDFALVRKHSM